MLHLNCECNLHFLVPLLSWTNESTENLQFTSCSLFSYFNTSSVLTYGEQKCGLTGNRTQNMPLRLPTFLSPAEPYGLTPFLTCLPTCWLISKRGKHIKKGNTYYHGFMLCLPWLCLSSHMLHFKATASVETFTWSKRMRGPCLRGKAQLVCISFSSMPVGLCKW